MTKKKKAKKGNVPALVKSSGTQVLGTVHSPYVQTDVPVKYALDVCDTLSRMLLADYHRAFCLRSDVDD